MNKRHYRSDMNVPVFQGDVGFVRVEAIPADAVRVTGKDAKVVTHSETGHHHVFDGNASVFVYSTPDQLISYLEVKKPAVLRHLRPHDTHEEILFDVGLYRVHRQREDGPDGWRQVLD